MVDFVNKYLLQYYHNLRKKGAKGDWDLRISDLVKNPDGTDINHCGEFRWSQEGPVNQIHSPHLHVGGPGIFSDLLGSVQNVQMQKSTYSSLVKLQPWFLSLRW